MKKSAHIRALAKFRGTSYKEAEEWFRTEELVLKGEAKMLGELEIPLAENQNPMFDLKNMGKGLVIAENGFLLPVPRPTTLQEDYDKLVADTERKMTEDPTRPITRKDLEDTKEAIDRASLEPTKYFMSAQEWYGPYPKREEDK
jgi:hypothetical protein